MTRVGEFYLSKDGQVIVYRIQGGLFCYARIPDLLAVIHRSLNKGPLMAKSYLGVDLEDAVARIQAERRKRGVTLREVSPPRPNEACEEMKKERSEKKYG